MSRPNITRRHFFQDCGVGVGKIALASLIADGAMGRLTAAGSGMRSGLPHHAPKAKAVIHLFMAGAPSQLELFDNKPELAKLEGKPLRPRSSTASAMRSSAPTPPYSVRALSSPVTASLALSFRRCCRTSRPSPMTSPS